MVITRELIVFLWFILDGIVGGIFFDFLRAIRHNKRSGNLLVYLEDILFWLLLGSSVIWTANFLDAGTVRMYMIIGMVLGIILYLLTLTKIIYKLLDGLFRYTTCIIGYIRKLFRGTKDEKESASI